MTVPAPIISTGHLAVGYRNGKQQVTLLKDLNLSLYRGELVALLGQNGAGKSTLLRALTCDESPWEERLRSMAKTCWK